MSRVSADSLLYIAGSVSLTISLVHCVAWMATGSGQPAADRPGIDCQVQVLDSSGIYDLNTKCVPDVLGLHARRPEAAVVKVMTGRDSWSVRCWSRMRKLETGASMMSRSSIWGMWTGRS